MSREVKAAMIDEPSKRERNKTERMARLVEIAQSLFIAQGFDQTSMEQVASAAKTTKRTVYQHFQSKEDLFYAVVLKAAEIIEKGFAQALSKDGTAKDKLLRINAFYAKLYLQDPGLFRIWTYSPRDKAHCATSPNKKKAELCRNDAAAHYFELMEQGRRDGSLTVGEDSRFAVFYCMFSTTSLLDFMSLLEPAFWSEQRLSQGKFIEYCFEALMRSLVAQR
jgi:AcrR family transcriptional regulator